jgi:hypothetical protein
VLDFIGSPPRSRYRSSALNDSDQEGNNRQDQQDVDEAAHRVGSDEPEKPQDKQGRKNRPEHYGSPLLVVVGMRMAPIPVIGLLSLAGLREFVTPLVVIGQVDSPGGVFAIIPVVVVLVVAIVDTDLDAFVFGSGSGQNSERSSKYCSEQKRTDATMCKAHVTILLWNSDISVSEQREVKVGFLVLPSATASVFPIYPFATAS